MRTIIVESVQRGELDAQIVASEEFTVRFEGVLREEESDGWLSSFLYKAYERSANRNNIVLDFRDLRFMNATAFRVFIPWLKLLQDRTPPCRLRIQHSPEIMWQSVAILSFKAVADNIISTEEVE